MNLIKELGIEEQYKLQPRRTGKELVKAYKVAKKTGYLTNFKLAQKGKEGPVDVFHLNPGMFEHLKQLPVKEEQEA